MQDQLVHCRNYEYKKVAEGSQVGRLTVLFKNGRSKNGSVLWHCKCSCGNEVDVVSSSLNNGLKQSCGCLSEDTKRVRRSTHGMSNTSTYNSWMAMKARCYNPKADFYDYYGGRGVTVCEAWLESFESFYFDMGEKPDGMSLDRIDFNAGYCKENCRWATNSEQGYNTRKHCNNSSGKTGVSRHKLSGKWGAYIGVDNEFIWLGLHETYEEAVATRLAAELKYFNTNKE